MKKQSIGIVMAVAAMVATLVSCVPTAQQRTEAVVLIPRDSGVQDFVHPQTGERRCTHLVDNLDTAGYSIIFTNNSDLYAVELAFRQEPGRATNLERLGEAGIELTITYPDGSTVTTEAQGKSSPTTEFTFDSLSLPLDLDTVQKLLAADGDVQFDYLGQQGYGAFTVPVSAWRTISSGFGETCLTGESVSADPDTE